VENDLHKISQLVRRNIIKMLVKAGSGHTAGPMGIADFLVTLYFGGVVNYDPNQPAWEDRDRVILSCGHYAPGLYATLAQVGYFPESELGTLRKLGTRLQGHVTYQKQFVGMTHNQLPGVENTGGPLGQGVSLSVGVAMAAKMDSKKWRTICVSSDGEQQEGQVWEAYMTAAKYELGNLIFVIDSNDIQITGNLKKIMPIEPLKQKLEAFGLKVREIDGHNYEEIKSVFVWSKLFPSQPKAIIMKTTPGKGVGFMENNYEWHGKAPTEKEGIAALIELEKTN